MDATLHATSQPSSVEDAVEAQLAEELDLLDSVPYAGMSDQEREDFVTDGVVPTPTVHVKGTRREGKGKRKLPNWIPRADAPRLAPHRKHAKELI